ncbi:AAA family ATPase [Desulfobulbus propionicus]
MGPPEELRERIDDCRAGSEQVEVATEIVRNPEDLLPPPNPYFAPPSTGRWPPRSAPLNHNFSDKGFVNFMNASALSQALELLIAIRQPVFLWGPPGIGKSQIVRQTADRADLQLIDLRAILLDPVDLRGLPRITGEGSAEWCAPAFFPRTGQGILFLDELNAAPPLVQASCYQLVLDRRLGEYELPLGWTVIAAGNRETDRAVAHRMPSALANRFVHIDFTVELDQWLLWAEANDISPEITAFLRFRPSLLHDFDPERSGRAFPSPRSWEFASRLLRRQPDTAILADLLTGTVGPAAAAELTAFLQIRQNLPSMEDILNAPQSLEIPTDPAVLFALCEMAGRAAEPDHARPLLDFAGRLPDEFSVLLVREAVRTCREIAGSDEFARWAERHAEVLV